MGYRGKLTERELARDLRAQSWTLSEIADRLGVSKSSVSLWVRDVEFLPNPRRTARRRGPNVLQRRKAAEIERFHAEGIRLLGRVSDQTFLAAGAALYAGEGAKRDGSVVFANTDPKMVSFFCRWLRTFFEIEEGRLTVRVYLHEGLDLDAAQCFWSGMTHVPLEQFRRGYRARADESLRHNKHEHGCAYVRYDSTRVHRAITGLIAALLVCETSDPG